MTFSLRSLKAFTEIYIQCGEVIFRLQFLEKNFGEIIIILTCADYFNCSDSERDEISPVQKKMQGYNNTSTLKEQKKADSYLSNSSTFLINMS